MQIELEKCSSEFQARVKEEINLFQSIKTNLLRVDAYGPERNVYRAILSDGAVYILLKQYPPDKWEAQGQIYRCMLSADDVEVLHSCIKQHTF